MPLRIEDCIEISGPNPRAVKETPMYIWIVRLLIFGFVVYESYAINASNPCSASVPWGYECVADIIGYEPIPPSPPPPPPGCQDCTPP